MESVFLVLKWELFYWHASRGSCSYPYVFRHLLCLSLVLTNFSWHFSNYCYFSSIGYVQFQDFQNNLLATIFLIFALFCPFVLKGDWEGGLMCSGLTMEIPELRHWHYSDSFFKKFRRFFTFSCSKLSLFS